MAVAGEDNCILFGNSVRGETTLEKASTADRGSAGSYRRTSGLMPASRWLPAALSGSSRPQKRQVTSQIDCDERKFSVRSNPVKPQSLTSSGNKPGSAPGKLKIDWSRASRARK